MQLVDLHASLIFTLIRHLACVSQPCPARLLLISVLTMIRHVVFFKFNPEATVSQRKEVIAGLRALPDKIDAIRTFELGEDIMRSARAWDFVLIATYDDLQALDVYTRRSEEHTFEL